MARYNNITSRLSSHTDNTPIADRVINSQPYQTAYAIFSQETDKTWLQLLEAIPFSVSDAENTIIDKIGLSNAYDDKQDANYQYCMEQIVALMRDYQTWKNSLPTTQAQQFADAGINAAITGQGISSSSIPNTGVSTNPASLSSTNTGEFISSAASFILDATSGLSSVVNSFGNLNLSKKRLQFDKDNALIDFHKYARENGFQLHGNDAQRGFHRGIGYTFDDIVSGKLQYTDPNGNSISSDAILRQYLTHDKNSRYLGALAALYPELNVGYDGDNVFTGIASTPVFIDETLKTQLEILRLQTLNQARQQKYSADIAEFEVGSTELENINLQYKNDTDEYNSKMLKCKMDYYKALCESDNIYDKMLAVKMLTGFTQSEMQVLSASGDAALFEKSAGFISQIINLFK